jgi:hypothetical protein
VANPNDPDKDHEAEVKRRAEQQRAAQEEAARLKAEQQAEREAEAQKAKAEQGSHPRPKI